MTPALVPVSDTKLRRAKVSWTPTRDRKLIAYVESGETDLCAISDEIYCTPGALLTRFRTLMDDGHINESYKALMGEWQRFYALNRDRLTKSRQNISKQELDYIAAEVVIRGRDPFAVGRQLGRSGDLVKRHSESEIVLTIVENMRFKQREANTLDITPVPVPEVLPLIESEEPEPVKSLAQEKREGLETLLYLRDEFNLALEEANKIPDITIRASIVGGKLTLTKTSEETL